MLPVRSINIYRFHFITGSNQYRLNIKANDAKTLTANTRYLSDTTNHILAVRRRPPIQPPTVRHNSKFLINILFSFTVPITYPCDHLLFYITISHLQDGNETVLYCSIEMERHTDVFC